jgi:predicted AAA+ superfamily ATPase
MKGPVERRDHCRRIERLLRERPIVAILGARQVGKTTLAHMTAEHRRGRTVFFDLEDPRHLAQLEEPTLTLAPLRGLVVLDEIQNRPGLFPVLRVLADRRSTPARFLVLGSASPDLLRQGSESLAGRVAFHELGGFSLEEVGPANLARLWFRGGFPRSYLGRSHRESAEWRRDFVRTFLERDLPRLGVGIPPVTLARFWTMLAHYHGQVWNASEFARSFGVSHTTVQKYLDLLTGLFLVRQLRPWWENVGKRTVKAAKVYLTDSGLLHTLLDLDAPASLERHPRVGASWEGFILEQVILRLRARSGEVYFWATHAGAELDLLVTRGSTRIGFEIKRTDTPRMTRSMKSAQETLKLKRLYVVHAGSASFDLERNVRAVAAADLLGEIRPLRS